MADSKVTKVLFDLLEEYREAKKAEKAAEEAYKDASARVRYLAEDLIPDQCSELGIEAGSKFKTDKGTLSVKEVVRASIPKDRQENAYEALDRAGEGGMIKRIVEVYFNKEQEQAAADLLKRLRKEFPNASQKRSVHHSTLSAWARRAREEGRPIPDDINVHVQKIIDLKE